MPKLVPCEVCKRHVRIEEHACPHCGISLPWAAFAVAASLGLLACESRNIGADVYGPPAYNPRDRMETAATPDASAPPPPATPPVTTANPPPQVAVYGPPPPRPELRVPTVPDAPDKPKK